MRPLLARRSRRPKPVGRIVPDLNRPNSTSLSRKRMSSLLPSAKSMFSAVLNFMILAPWGGEAPGKQIRDSPRHFLNARNSKNTIDNRKMSVLDASRYLIHSRNHYYDESKKA